MAWTTSGTCEWEIASGVLTVRPIDLVSGTLETWTAGASVPWYAYKDAITSVVFESGCIAQTCYYMFYGCTSLTSVDLSGLDTSNVTDMSYMFRDCTSLTSIDLSGLDTSRVTNMRSMFLGCTSLVSVDLSGLNTSNVTIMDSVFSSCSSLVSVDLSGLDTSSVTIMSAMFYGCTLLEKLVLGAATTLRNDTNQWVNVPTTWYKQGSETSTTLTEIIALSGTTAGAGTWTTYLNLNSASVPIPTSSVDFGDTAAGTFTPVVSTNTFTGYVSLGSSTADLTVDNTGSYSVAIPTAWAAEIPSASSGTATVYLLTYDDTATLLGTKSATFTINIPTTWTPTVTLNLLSSDGDQDYIVNSSYIIATASASDLNYATIASWALSSTDGTSSTTSSLNTNILTDAIEYTVTATLTDSRGNVVTETSSVTPSAYTYPVPDGSVELGNTATGTFDPDTGITYTGTITLGTSSVDLVIGDGIYSADLPISWCNELPDSESGTAHVSLTSYEDEVAVGIGYGNFTVTVPDSVVPTVTLVVNPSSGEYYLKDENGATLTATAAGAYGSTIVSYDMKIIEN